MPDPERAPDDSPWRSAAAVVSRNLPDGVLVFAPGMVAPVALTGPASSLWDLLAEGLTRPEIVAELARLYGTDADRVNDDLTSAWDELVSSRIIEPAPR